MKWASVIALAAGLIITSAHGAPVRAEFPYPPDIILAGRILEYNSPATVCNDVYARIFVQYKADPTQRCVTADGPRNVVTHAGWRILQTAPESRGPCYTIAQCVGVGRPRWRASTRLAVTKTTVIGRDIASRTHRCPAGRGGPLPADTLMGIQASAPCETNDQCTSAGYRQMFTVYGFDPDDPDGPGPAPPQAVTPDLPCGLPYKMVPVMFLDATDNPDRFQIRLFRVVVYEQWWRLYWSHDPGSGRYLAPVLERFPQLSAIPPLPGIEDMDFDRRFSGGGRLMGAAIAGTAQQPLRILLDGDYTIEDGLLGHGLIVVTGNLTVHGALEYAGSLMVQGTLTLMPEFRIHRGPRDRRPAPD